MQSTERLTFKTEDVQERSDEVKYILETFKSKIGDAKLNELRNMFH